MPEISSTLCFETAKFHWERALWGTTQEVPARQASAWERTKSVAILIFTAFSALIYAVGGFCWVCEKISVICCGRRHENLAPLHNPGPPPAPPSHAPVEHPLPNGAGPGAAHGPQPSPAPAPAPTPLPAPAAEEEAKKVADATRELAEQIRTMRLVREQEEEAKMRSLRDAGRDADGNITEKPATLGDGQPKPLENQPGQVEDAIAARKRKWQAKHEEEEKKLGGAKPQKPYVPAFRTPNPDDGAGWGDAGLPADRPTESGAVPKATPVEGGAAIGDKDLQNQKFEIPVVLPPELVALPANSFRKLELEKMEGDFITLPNGDSVRKLLGYRWVKGEYNSAGNFFKPGESRILFVEYTAATTIGEFKARIKKAAREAGYRDISDKDFNKDFYFYNLGYPTEAEVKDRDGILMDVARTVVPVIRDNQKVCKVFEHSIKAYVAYTQSAYRKYNIKKDAFIDVHPNKSEGRPLPSRAH